MNAGALVQTVGLNGTSAREREGKRRRVGVRVNRPNLTIRTRRGYFAPTSTVVK